MVSSRILSLFSGVGGLDIAVCLSLPGSRVVGYVERDAYAAAVLMARMEDSSLGRAPVFVGDIQDLDGSELAGRVDIICGGFPCQDISVAGRGEGIGGKRSGLWSEIVRLADEIRPRYIFLENVSAIITRGLSTVLADLAALGFDSEWLCLRASDVGAPHRRERWFCLGYSECERLERGSSREYLRTGVGKGCLQLGVSGAGRDRRGTLDNPKLERDDREPPKPLRAGWQATDVASRPFPPGPADHDAWRDILGVYPHLTPAVESGFRVFVDGSPVVLDESRADQLRCCGNGVVPLQAAVAFTELLRRVTEG